MNLRKKSKTLVLIPARLNSTRFPNKPLIDLNGKTMIRTVFDKCESFGYDTLVLTDSYSIMNEVPNGNALITNRCDNGTDRCMGVIDTVIKDYDKYINVQGDNPDVTEEVLSSIEDKLDCCDVVNAYTNLHFDSIDNKDHVKAIITNDVIHWYTRSSVSYGYKVLGFHGYRSGLSELWNYFKKYEGEKYEDVEQLRWIENNKELNGVYVPFSGIEINNQHDYESWKISNNSKII